MENYIPIVAVVGFALLGMAWMPALAKVTKISYSIVYVIIGIVLYSTVDFLPEPDPLQYQNFSVRLTELMVIVSLMGTGLKIDQPFTFKSWRIPLRLVSITMLLSIAVVAVLGIFWLNLDIPSAILLGAVLAPTDPVLADDVQVGPPQEETQNESRFALTAEAGLNDGMAFPFTWLAITLSLMSANETTLSHWFLFDFLYRLAAGVVIGFIIGRIIAYLVLYLPSKKSFFKLSDGFVAFSLTLLVYGVTELAKGYGFVAVFVCAITLRNYELEHKYHLQLHSFTGQMERMLMAIVLILFGGALSEKVFTSFSWLYVFFALVLVFIVRPCSGYVSVLGSKLHFQEKAAISFYGIKGIGSFFYLAFAIQHAEFQQAEELWSIVSWVVLCSLLIHGISATHIMTKVEERFGKQKPQKVKKE